MFIHNGKNKFIFLGERNHNLSFHYFISNISFHVENKQKSGISYIVNMVHLTILSSFTNKTHTQQFRYLYRVQFKIMLITFVMTFCNIFFDVLYHEYRAFIFNHIGSTF